MTGAHYAQDQLRISEERYRIALESAGMAAWDWNIKEDAISWNENHYTMLGLLPDNEKKDASFFLSFVHIDDKDKIEVALKLAVATAGEFIEEFRLTPSGNDAVIWVKGYGSTIDTENGHATRMVGVMFDITEQKLFTDELSRQVDQRTLELQRSNNDLQQFAHVASHDLKEPVRKIRTFYSRIMEEFGEGLPDELVLYLKRIEISAARMYAMIEGVLHYSKLGSNYELSQEVDLNKVIREIADDLEVLIEDKKAIISPSELPLIEASPTLIYQLFYNLILNSLKFARADEPSRIFISSYIILRDDVNYLQIIVSDNGIGFEQQQAENIFNTFIRLNSADHYEGTGLGLALCKKIVERYNGIISAKGSWVLAQNLLYYFLKPRTLLKYAI